MAVLSSTAKHVVAGHRVVCSFGFFSAAFTISNAQGNLLDITPQLFQLTAVGTYKQENIIQEQPAPNPPANFIIYPGFL